MADEKSRNPPTSNSDPVAASQVDANLANGRETLPSGSRPASQFDGVTPLASTLVDIYDSAAIDPVYQAKSHAISCAVQQIGMGRYQVRLPPCRVWKRSSASC